MTTCVCIIFSHCFCLQLIWRSIDDFLCLQLLSGHMKIRVLSFHQFLRQLQALQQNMCATSVAKFSAAMIHLHITRVSTGDKRDAPFVRSCSLANTLCCLIYQSFMALNISTDNINSSFYLLWEVTFHLVSVSESCIAVMYTCT